MAPRAVDVNWLSAMVASPQNQICYHHARFFAGLDTAAPPGRGTSAGQVQVSPADASGYVSAKNLKLQKLSIAFLKKCARIESTILMEVYISWPMLLVTLASAAVPALRAAPWALSLRATTTTSSTPAPASIAAPALVPAPWALSPRANDQKNSAGSSGAVFINCVSFSLCT